MFNFFRKRNKENKKINIGKDQIDKAINKSIIASREKSKLYNKDRLNDEIVNYVKFNLGGSRRANGKSDKIVSIIEKWTTYIFNDKDFPREHELTVHHRRALYHDLKRYLLDDVKIKNKVLSRHINSIIRIAEEYTWYI